MSLLRQLLLSVTVVIVVILTGTLVFSVDGARDYLNAQLQAESDNAATSLALSLSQPSNQDPALRELLVTALFDSGQFQAIELHDTQGNELVSRRVERSAHVTAPDWFSTLLPLRAPHATRQVADGWTQVGELTVIADDSEARNSLWESTTRVLIWVLIAGLLWLAFVVGLMRWLRRALHDEITTQVDSIVEGRAAEPTKGRKQIADLLPDQQVITQARERVQASKQEAAQHIENLTVELNHDAVTGVPNRRYFMNELRRVLQNGESERAPSQVGHILLCRQRDLVAMSAALPRDQVDAWLRGVGERMQKVLGQFDDASLQLGRLNGSDFAVLIPDAEGPQAMLIAQNVRQALLEARIAVSPGRHCRWAFAMTDFVSGDDLSIVFSRLDTALMGAESAGHSDVETLLSTQASEGATHGIVGEAAWRSLLTNALAESHVQLAVQQANYGRKRTGPGRYEASLSISDPSHNQGEALSGFSFMPAAVRLGLSAELDARAIELAIDWLKSNRGELVVRVSVPSLLKPEFLDSLRKTLGTVAAAIMQEPSASAGRRDEASTDAGAEATPRTGASLLRRLVIELDAYGLASYPAEVTAFCKAMHDNGVRIGLRGVAQQLDAVARLQGLPVSYIKLGGGFMTDLESSQGAMSLLNAVIHTAAALRIKVLVDESPGEVAAMLLRDHGAQLKA